MKKLAYLGLAMCLSFGVARSARAEIVPAGVANEVVINRSPEEVFAFATTAENWAKWHPNTLRTEGADHHSATVGEEITEWLRVGPVPLGKITWTVAEHIEPERWVFAIEMPGDLGRFAIIYTFQAGEEGTTIFRREMALETDRTLLGLMFSSLSRPFLALSSEVAVQRLKKAIEGSDEEVEGSDEEVEGSDEEVEGSDEEVEGSD